ncbi:MAG: electron transfer flavoprotein subunit beta/FixA family protein [Candidatus Eisenbacteria bacterium]|uniref:Electron transfer flavoprotein subunit beta n=1 Tax=Eiseniibacteriota bacterium TaxID=2212470 RepID=A0A7Y2H204_UNCEI|nr:electron transfer flavoprotein subunit beta/FixA family protein [Candidatus Eisenbacteria bacterium]
MKILVCVKQVPATDSRIKPTGDGVGVDLSSVDWIINPYDEFAIEEALQLKAKHDGEVVVVSIGGDKVEDAMRSALALGVDTAEVIKDAGSAASDSLGIAKGLAAIAKRHNPDLILCGKQAVDDDQMAVPAMLAELLDLPQATVVVGMEVAEDGKSAKVDREIEGGHEKIEVTFPAVIATQKGLNEPRYANLKGIMAAKKKKIEVLSAADLGLGEFGSKVEVLAVNPPAEKTGARMIEGDAAAQVTELIKVLHDEEKII